MLPNQSLVIHPPSSSQHPPDHLGHSRDSSQSELGLPGSYHGPASALALLRGTVAAKQS